MAELNWDVNTFVHMSKKYFSLSGTLNQTKNRDYLYNEYELGGLRLLNIKALNLSLKSSFIQKFYLKPKWFSS